MREPAGKKTRRVFVWSHPGECLFPSEPRFTDTVLPYVLSLSSWIVGSLKTDAYQHLDIVAKGRSSRTTHLVSRCSRCTSSSGSTFCSRPQDGDRIPHRTKYYRLYETAFSLASFQAVNCQATLIKSLRDKNASCLLDPHSPAIGRRPRLVSSMY